jgi:hypothetical protein
MAARDPLAPGLLTSHQEGDPGTGSCQPIRSSSNMEERRGQGRGSGYHYSFLSVSLRRVIVWVGVAASVHSRFMTMR